MKTALITGISGQDGSYLAELLLDKGYQVHGIVRRVALESSDQRLGRIRHLLNRLHLHGASLESYPSLFHVVHRVKPDEIYHLAAQSYVSYSFEDEFATMTMNVDGTHYMLAAARELVPKARFYFAATSEMFGAALSNPQNEDSVFRPRSPYGISKVAGYYLTRNYREAYRLFACSGILFNHESPRRGLEFVTRKITSQAVKIKLGIADELRLGNIDAKRDWGHAREYVKAMWLMLQQERPEDFVIASGETRSVWEFVEVVFSILGLDPSKYVKIDTDLLRPADVEHLIGDPSKARKQLNWSYTMTFHDLVKEMVEADLELYSREVNRSTSHSRG
jgi:GDPmannose 4,6-dehydratase